MTDLDDRAAWAVCSYLRARDAETDLLVPACKQCPRHANHPVHGSYVRGCRLQADEIVRLAAPAYRLPDVNPGRLILVISAIMGSAAALALAAAYLVGTP